MTRINAGISPSRLTDAHLLAEHREITRVIQLSRKNKSPQRIYEFTLGSGHVKFFYDKLDYIYTRYRELLVECIERDFNVEDKSSMFDYSILEHYENYQSNWKPDRYDKNLVEDRIINRISGSKREPRYKREKITKNKAIELLLL